MSVELQDSFSKTPPSVNMNNEYAPSVPLPTVPTCKWDFLLQVKIGKICPLNIFCRVTGHTGPLALQHFYISTPQLLKSMEFKEGGGVGLTSHMDWQHQLTLRDSRAAAHPAKIMLHTSATTAGGITRVSRVSGHQPAAAGGQQIRSALYTDL